MHRKDQNQFSLEILTKPNLHLQIQLKSKKNKVKVKKGKGTIKLNSIVEKKNQTEIPEEGITIRVNGQRLLNYETRNQ